MYSPFSQRAVVLEPHERRLYTMVQQLNTIRNAKVGHPCLMQECMPVI
jgi:hypothetical protein